MKFLIDMPLSPALVNWLIERGHVAIHATAANLARASDEDVMKHARAEQQIVVTADLDYPRLLALTSSDSPAIILFRGGNFNEVEMVALLASVLEAVSAEELVVSFIVVDRHRLRKRSLPLK
jgi:predicted nuclease of predicted toxin-antitoxin system